MITQKPPVATSADYDTSDRVRVSVWLTAKMNQELRVLFAKKGCVMQQGIVGMLRNEITNAGASGCAISWFARTPVNADVPKRLAAEFAKILADDAASQKPKDDSVDRLMVSDDLIMAAWREGLTPAEFVTGICERAIATSKAEAAAEELEFTQEEQRFAESAEHTSTKPPVAQSAPAGAKAAPVSQQFAHDYWPDYPEQVDWSKMTDIEQVRHYIRSREWNDPLPTGPATEAERAGMLLYKGITDVQLYRKMVRAEMKNKWEQEVLKKFGSEDK